MKKTFLGFFCFFLLFSCSVTDSSDCGCGFTYYDVSLNTTVVDSKGNSFRITEVRLENEILSFIGDYIFQNIDSSGFFLSIDGSSGLSANPHDFEYYFDLEATNERNETALTGRYLTLSGEWILCFPVDDFFLTEMESFSYPEFGGDKELYAYFMINDERAYTSFHILFSQIVVA